MIESPPKTGNILNLYTLLNNKEIDLLIKDINSKYLYWDKVKYQPRPQNISAEELWSMVKIVRGFNNINISSDTTPMTFNIYVTDKMQEMLHHFDMNIGGVFGKQNLIPEQDKHKYLVNSVMEEAIASSQMEGASTTRRKAKEMLRKGDKPKNRSEQMIANNFITIKHITNNPSEPLTQERLLEIHRLITKDTLDNHNEEGKFRDSDDIFVVDHSNSEIVHTPPPYKDLHLWIDDLCELFNDESKFPVFIHPIIKAIIIHFIVGYTHPFCDGNGRTARALFYWYMLRKGYWLTEYLSISRIIYKNKSKYEKAYLYTEIDNNDLSYFLQYNLEVMNQALIDFKEYLKNKMQEQSNAINLMSIGNINDRQASIINILRTNAHSILTVKEMLNRFSISHPTAKRDLQGLIDLGLLRAISVNKIKTNYVITADFDKRLEELIR